MQIKKYLFLSIMLLFTKSHAYLVNGEMLIEDISSRKALATGYIEGVSDTANTKIFCIPEGTTSSMLRNVAHHFLLNNPDQLAQPASRLVIEAFRSEYPCS